MIKKDCIIRRLISTFSSARTFHSIGFFTISSSLLYRAISRRNVLIMIIDTIAKEGKKSQVNNLF